MSLGFRKTLINAAVDGSALASSTTPTSILTAPAKFQFLAGMGGVGLANMVPGDRLLVRATGRISNMNPTPGTITLDLRLGAVIIANGGAISLNTAAAKTNVTLTLEWELTLRAIGSGTSANFFHTGKFMSEAVNGAGVGQAFVALLPASAPAVGTGFDSTASIPGFLDLFATFSVNNAANSIQVHQYELIAET